MIHLEVDARTEVYCACGWSRGSVDDDPKTEIEFLFTSWKDHAALAMAAVDRPTVVGLYDTLNVTRNGVLTVHKARFAFVVQTTPWGASDEFPVVLSRTSWTIRDLTELIHSSNERSSTLLTSKYLQESTFLTQSGGHL